MASHAVLQPANASGIPATDHALPAENGREALERMLQAAARGDADACRAAMDSLHASPEAQAWRKRGQESLLAQQGIAPSHEHPDNAHMVEVQGRTAPALVR